MEPVDRLKKLYEVLSPVMDERVTRLWAAAEAEAIGRSGVTVVTLATGILHKRIVAGKRELEALRTSPQQALAQGRTRRHGGGRKALEVHDPGLVKALEELIDPVTRGDPMSPLRWTCKSSHRLAAELSKSGHPVGATKVRMLLGELGYTLQSNRKTREGNQHPERDAQFQHINRQAKAFQKRGQPVISVDTKKKELLGDFKNGGREWQPGGKPEPVRVHDFLDKELGKAVPYGVYDVIRNDGWVSVGNNHDTAEFAVESIRRWWLRMGRQGYPGAKELLVTADGGGSNGSRTRLWKAELQKLSDETGLDIQVAHYPPGTSKWNKIEHRMFCHITQNWRGRPLLSLETVVNLIAATTTKQGLHIRAAPDRTVYQKARVVSDEQMAQLKLRRSRVRGLWNYRISPNG